MVEYFFVDFCLLERPSRDRKIHSCVASVISFLCNRLKRISWRRIENDRMSEPYPVKIDRARFEKWNCLPLCRQTFFVWSEYYGLFGGIVLQLWDSGRQFRFNLAPFLIYIREHWSGSERSCGMFLRVVWKKVQSWTFVQNGSLLVTLI